MTRSPHYTIAERRERPLDPDGLVGAQYLPPPFRSFGPRFSIRPKLSDKGTDAQSGQTKPVKCVGVSAQPSTDLHDSHGSLPRFPVAAMVAAHENERMNARAAVHEPDCDSRPPFRTGKGPHQEDRPERGEVHVRPNRSPRRQEAPRRAQSADVDDQRKRNR